MKLYFLVGDIVRFGKTFVLVTSGGLDNDDEFSGVVLNTINGFYPAGFYSTSWNKEEAEGASMDEFNACARQNKTK